MITKVTMMITMKDRDQNQDDDHLPVTETIKTIKYKYRWNQRSFLELCSTGNCTFISSFDIPANFSHQANQP